MISTFSGSRAHFPTLAVLSEELPGVAGFPVPLPIHWPDAVSDEGHSYHMLEFLIPSAHSQNQGRNHSQEG